uniref:Plac8 onzin related protein 6 n=1 Tax=Cyprinus carpio carpio TaxID=630221 RepID=A0A9J7X9J8_CYPCA
MMAHSAISVQPAMMVTTSNAMLNQWSSGVCDCCEDMGVCCCGFWCPYCLMCRTSEEFGECLCLPLLEMCFGRIIPPVTLSMRSSMRERFHIKNYKLNSSSLQMFHGSENDVPSLNGTILPPPSHYRLLSFMFLSFTRFDVLFSFMKGSIQDDCCVVTFCTLCVWCQMARELKARRHSLVIINPAVNPVHQSVQVFNQPLQPINPAY